MSEAGDADGSGRPSLEVATLERLDDLIARAAGVGREAWSEYHGLYAQALAAVSSITGADSDYYRELARGGKDPYAIPSGAGNIGEILKALRADVDRGYLRRTSDLVAAEVFGDFLDMAEHLLEAGFFQPAASLIGAVLEDRLRRLLTSRKLKVNRRDDLAAMNHRAADAGAYSNLIRKQVDVWTTIRNHADHGEFEAFAADDVREMYRGVVRFMAEPLDGR